MSRIVRNAIRCVHCGDVIESVHRHDWRQCTCQTVFVDGGKSYLRRGFKKHSDFEDLSEFTEDDELEYGEKDVE